MTNQQSTKMNENCLKLKLDNTVYKINDIKGQTLDELKVIAFTKFGLGAQDYEFIAKIPNAKNIQIKEDSDVPRAILASKVDNKGRKVLDIKLVDRSKVETPKPEVCFQNWEILSESDRISLKEKATAKAQAKIKSDDSDSSVSPDFNKFKKHTGEWDNEKWATFETLLKKFPTAPKWVIGKAMKKNPNKSEGKLEELINAKIEKFTLKTEEQLSKFAELRKEFPRMREMMLNRIIINNPDWTMEQLKKRGLKLREKMMKWRKDQDRSESPRGRCGKMGGRMGGCGMGPRGLWAKLSGQAGDLMTKFQTLEAKFPDFPQMKIGKIVMKNKDLTVEELTEKINAKIGKFNLVSESQKLMFAELRKEFPRMPSFFLNKIITKNPNFTIEQLKQRVTKRKGKMMQMREKFGGAMKMLKGWMGCRSGSNSKSRSKSNGNPERFKDVEILCEKFPAFPKWKIAKIVKRNPDLSVEKVAERIVERLSKFELKTEQQRNTFALLRQNFPRMPEFILNKMIIKNQNMTIDQLIAKGVQKREKMMKHRGGRHGHGPHGHGPHGHGPRGFGPHGHGPHGHGPHGHGPHRGGPHGHGPRRSSPESSTSPDWTAEDKETFTLLMKEFPTLSAFRIGTVMKNNAGKSFNKLHDRLSEICQKKTPELTEAQTDKIQTLIKIFPNFPENRMKNIVKNNSEAELLQLVDIIHKKLDA
jgi:hypothetical protein